MSSSGEVSPSGSVTPTPPTCPKYGTVIPNRIFVGGIAANVSAPTTEQELKQFFSAYGAVKDTKIIADRAGVSKGYGFVTFECQEDAEKIIKKEADNLMFKDRKLNIGPAIRKQQFPRLYGDSNYLSAEPVSQGVMVNGVPFIQSYTNGMAFFQPESASYQPQQPTYPVMVQPSGPVYAAVSQPYANAAPSAQWAAAAAAQAQQWRWQQTAAAPQYIYPTMQPVANETMYAQPAYQTADFADASMMEAAPAEGSVHHSMVVTENMTPTAYQQYPGTNCIGALSPPPQPATTMMTSESMSMQPLQTQPACAPALVQMAPQQRTIPYKRPLSAPNLRGTPAMGVRSTPTPSPPVKIAAGHIPGCGHQLMPKPMPREHEGYHRETMPLTPPPTPDVLRIQHLQPQM